jgi:hypothetical protein
VHVIGTDDPGIDREGTAVPALSEQSIEAPLSGFAVKK